MPNREQRRHPKQTPTPPAPAERAREPVDPRTKNSGHGKKTADKWNQ
jgi:hypothetical protein